MTVALRAGRLHDAAARTDMKNRITMALAALLLGAAARADDEAGRPARGGDAIEERARLRDGTADELRERARERMHEALAEHAPRPPDAAAGAAAREHSRDRDRAREEMATHAAERHAKRIGAGEAGRARSEEKVHASGEHGGMRHGDCDEAAGQHRMTEIRHGGDGMDGDHMGTR
jgi:hypothetical protein